MLPITLDQIRWLKTLLGAYTELYYKHEEDQTDVDPSATAEMMDECKRAVAALEEQALPSLDLPSADEIEAMARFYNEEIPF